jgi:hypothetical protein
MAAERKRVVERRRAAAVVTTRPATPRPKFRLPGGSTLAAEYSAIREVWSGTLSVPGSGEFTGEADTALRLLDVLGQLYHSTVIGAITGNSADNAADTGAVTGKSANIQKEGV